jgi:hypothetical protein
VPETSRSRQWLRTILSIGVVAAVFALHFRFVLVNFSLGATPLDTGWFAWLFAEGDPWLINPRIINGLSYYNTHVSPYLSAWSVVLHFFSVDRFTAFALHQGVAFAILAAAVMSLAYPVRSWFVFAAAMVFVLIGDLVLQYATFPHFEIGILAFGLLGASLWVGGRRLLAGVAFLIACLVREDGGLFVAVLLIAVSAAQPPARWLRSPEVILAAVAVVLSAAMLAVKSVYFPGFPTFAFNYSGHNWDHVTPAFVLQRLRDLLDNPQALIAIGTSLVLALFSRRYLVLPVLMLPLVGLQLLAVRDLLGHFVFYYAMPFLVITAGQLLVASVRARSVGLARSESSALLVAAILGASPVLYAIGLPSSLPMLAATLSQPARADLLQVADQTAAVVTKAPSACVSFGVAALIPDTVDHSQLIAPDSDLAPCATIFLFRSDVHYDALKPAVSGWTLGSVIADRIEPYSRP